jgi:hypothetical protein
LSIVGGQHTVRREALDGEGASDADALVVFVGLIVDQLGVGAAGDAGVNGGLALAAKAPPV